MTFQTERTKLLLPISYQLQLIALLVMYGALTFHKEKNLPEFARDCSRIPPSKDVSLFFVLADSAKVARCAVSAHHKNQNLVNHLVL